MIDLPKTDVPCPPWCELEARHPFDSLLMNKDRELVRDHRQVVSEVRYVERDQDRVFDRHVTVQIEAYEEANWAETVVDTGPPLVHMYGLEDGFPLTGPQARQIAAALLNAATSGIGCSRDRPDRAGTVMPAVV